MLKKIFWNFTFFRPVWHSIQSREHLRKSSNKIYDDDQTHLSSTIIKGIFQCPDSDEGNWEAIYNLKMIYWIRYSSFEQMKQSTFSEYNLWIIQLFIDIAYVWSYKFTFILYIYIKVKYFPFLANVRVDEEKLHLFTYSLNLFIVNR